MDSVAGDFWAIASLTLKLLNLLAMAGVIGGSFSLLLAQQLGIAREPALARYLLLSAVLGLCTTVLWFLVQVGAINQAGLAGMLDWNMAVILADTKPGYITGLRLLGFAGVIPAWLWLARTPDNAGHRLLQTAGRGFPLLGLAMALCMSFTLIGHVSTLASAARIAIVVHVFAVFLWIGSLYPLLRLSTDTDLARVHKLMKVFGTCALLIVGALLLSGVFLLTRLVQPFSELLTTPYGRTLALKLVGFMALLALAGSNKLLLVPRLTTGNAVKLLRASIRMELVVALFILSVTVWLTTALGPVV